MNCAVTYRMRVARTRTSLSAAAVPLCARLYRRNILLYARELRECFSLLFSRAPACGMRSLVFLLYLYSNMGEFERVVW